MIANDSYAAPELLSRIADGNEEAFAELYTLYAPRLRAYGFSFTKSEADAEEIIQSTFLSVWVNRDELPQIIQFNAWIYKVIARHCLQWLRKSGRELKKIKFGGGCPS